MLRGCFADYGNRYQPVQLVENTRTGTGTTRRVRAVLRQRDRASGRPENTNPAAKKVENQENQGMEGETKRAVVAEWNSRVSG